jgi:hypothetical protein
MNSKSITRWLTRRREAAGRAWLIEQERCRRKWVTSTALRQYRLRFVMWDLLLDAWTVRGGRGKAQIGFVLGTSLDGEEQVILMRKDGLWRVPPRAAPDMHACVVRHSQARETDERAAVRPAPEPTEGETR